MSKEKVVIPDEISDEQLEAILKERREKQRLASIEKKEVYERDRNALVVEIMSEAVDVSGTIIDFKQRSMKRLSLWLERLREYGEGKDDQENFQLVSADGNFKILYTQSISMGFDERSKLAEEKLKAYLEDKVKKRDKDSYKLIISLLERNTVTQELDISNIQRLYKMEDEINDTNFSESMALFRESYVERASKNYARFYRKGESNEWIAVKLDFAAL